MSDDEEESLLISNRLSEEKIQRLKEIRKESTERIKIMESYLKTNPKDAGVAKETIEIAERTISKINEILD